MQGVTSPRNAGGEGSKALLPLGKKFVTLGPSRQGAAHMVFSAGGGVALPALCAHNDEICENYSAYPRYKNVLVRSNRKK